jgi:DNA-binding NtrC family response regulator
VISRRLEAENPTTVHTAAATPSVDVANPLRSHAILVVDDEPAVAALLAELVTLEGHEVETAPNGAIALTKLRGRVYKLILCDLKMPELDGPGLYREVMRHDPEMTRRFIFITGSAPTSEVTKFLKQTGAPSLRKPFDLDELQGVIRKVLQAVS